jgi:hypothetical protein
MVAPSLCHVSDHADEIHGTIVFASRGVDGSALASATEYSYVGVGAHESVAKIRTHSAFHGRRRFRCVEAQMGGCSAFGGSRRGEMAAARRGPVAGLQDDRRDDDGATDKGGGTGLLPHRQPHPHRPEHDLEQADERDLRGPGSAERRS